MKRGRSTRVELQTAAQGLPTAPVLLPPSPLCERCVCCHLSGSCHGKCIQKQPKQTGLVSATLHSGGQREPWLNFSGFEDLNGVSQLHSQRIRLRRFRNVYLYGYMNVNHSTGWDFRSEADRLTDQVPGHFNVCLRRSRL